MSERGINIEAYDYVDEYEHTITDLCEHISIKGYFSPMDSFDIQGKIPITCKICNKTYYLKVGSYI